MGARRLVEGTRLVFCDFETTGVGEHDYPIEVGLVITDHELNALDNYTALIQMGDFQHGYGGTRKEWYYHHQEAYKVHGIEVQQVKDDGLDAFLVLREISSLIDGDYTHILVSDNAAFEQRMMKKLFAYVTPDNYPFHHSTWDVSLLAEICGVASMLKNKPHRAWEDANLMHQVAEQCRDHIHGL